MASPSGLQPQTLLECILDTVGVAIAVIDKHGEFVLANQSALDMFRAQRTGRTVQEWWHDYEFRDGQGHEIPLDRSAIMRALAGEKVEAQDVKVKLPDGSSKWLHAAGHRFSVMGLTGVLNIVTDETEEVKLRHALERAQRIEVAGLLAGATAHDFNNMLQVISENVALALADEDASPAIRDRLQHIATALKKGAALATRLVHYGRTQTMHTHPVQINDEVYAVLELVRPLLKTGVRAKAELACCLPTVEADPSRIEQVLVNLILNALDAMPKGGELTLRTELESDEIEPESTTGEKKQFVHISVIDTGFGIPESLLSDIFDPYFTTKEEGTGMGLSSADAIVRQHNGRISVQSTPGAGTTFSVYLPVGETAAADLEKG